MDELVGVVNLYPWFGAARKELCLRMSRMGGDSWGKSQYADSALYIGERGILSDMLRASQAKDWTDADVENLIKSYISSQTDPDAGQPEKRKVYAGVGDYFSQADYDQVRRADDNVFSK